MKNTPYVAIKNEFGEVTNPINRAYVSPFKNRRERRAQMKIGSGSHIGNGHNTPINVHGTLKYLRQQQVLVCSNTGELKTIKHFVLLKK